MVLLCGKPGPAQDSALQSAVAWEEILHFDWLSCGWEVVSCYPDAGEAVGRLPNYHWLLLEPRLCLQLAGGGGVGGADTDAVGRGGMPPVGAAA